jgi:hypothetical protein
MVVVRTSTLGGSGEGASTRRARVQHPETVSACEGVENFSAKPGNEVQVAGAVNAGVERSACSNADCISALRMQ